MERKKKGKGGRAVRKRKPKKAPPKDAPKGAKLSLRPIPPTLRGKKRYILFELKCPKTLRERDVSHAVMKEFLRLFGELGTAERGPRLVDWDSKEGVGILLCTLEAEEDCKAGLLFLKSIDDADVTPKITRVSGSIAKLRG